MLAANLGLLFVALSWGSVIPSLAFLLGTWDPYFLATARYALAAPLMLILLRLLEGPLPLFAGLPGWRWWLLGAIGVGMFATLFTVGLHYANPITVAILNSMNPLVTAIVGRVVYRIPIPARMLPGMLLAIAGCIYATYDPTAAGQPFDLRGGEILVVGAMICWAWYSITPQVWMPGCSQLRVAGVTAATGSVALILIELAAGLVGEVRLPPAPPGGAADIAVLLWLPLVPVLLGNVLWLKGVRKLSPVTAALFMNLVPITAVLITWVLGIQPTRQQILGGCVVLAGILLAQLRWKRA